MSLDLSRQLYCLETDDQQHFDQTNLDCAAYQRRICSAGKILIRSTLECERKNKMFKPTGSVVGISQVTKMIF